MGRTQQMRVYCWIFTQHPKKENLSPPKNEKVCSEKGSWNPAQGKVFCCSLLCTCGKPGSTSQSSWGCWRARLAAEGSAGRCTEEIITFPIYPLFFNSRSFHYVANSFGYSSTTSYVYSVKQLKINEVGALLISKGPFAQHPNSNTAPHCQGSLGRGNIVSV